MRRPADQGRPPRDLGQDSFELSIVEGQHIVPGRLDQEEALQLVQLLGPLPCEVVRLCPVLAAIVELPHVVVEGLLKVPNLPGGRVLVDRRQPLVVDAAVKENLEYLGGRTPAAW